MAFPQSNPQRDLTNRKILEELQLKKQMLLKQGAQPTTTSNSISPTIPLGSTSATATLTATTSPADSHSVSSAQRAALHSAHTQSFGYFITQDSSFGNLILPVLPRYDTK